MRLVLLKVENDALPGFGLVWEWTLAAAASAFASFVAA